MSERLLTSRELAEYLGLSSATVLDWFEAGRLPGFRLGGRKGGPVRFRLSEVEVVLEGWRVGPDAAEEVSPTPRRPARRSSVPGVTDPVRGGRRCLLDSEASRVNAASRGWPAGTRTGSNEPEAVSRRARSRSTTRTGKADEAVTRANAIRFGDSAPAPTATISTVSELVDAFLARHRVDEATLRKLRSQFKHATAAFGDRRPETLQPIELDLWRSQLPALSAHYFFRAFRQVLEYAVAMGLLDRNPTARIRNVRAAVEVKRGQRPFESWEQVEAIAAELDPRFAAIPVVLVGTGLRPEELFALERRDLDLDAGVLSVERVYSQRRVEGLRQVEPPATARAAASAGRRRAPGAPAASRHAASVPGRDEAATSTARSFATATGRPRCGRQASSTGASTTAATPSPHGRSPAACSSSTSPGSWARAWRRSTPPTGTCCPTRRSTCVGCSTTTTAAQRRLTAMASRRRVTTRAIEDRHSECRRCVDYESR